ncbi:sensor histidine kinase [Pontibacter pamirensis]|uniref:sensor histidine kinase n=1 Tax=Pontibacter pamirensis TaxID=2562824 RepID=UPI00138A2EE8|nr:ATP-binding protein [Pontibacter pamirensis]
MHFFSFLAGFLLIRRIKKPLEKSSLYIKWQSLFAFSGWAVVALFFVVSFFFSDEASVFLGSIFLLGLLLYLEKEPDFSEFKPYIQANYPLVFAGILNSFVGLAMPDFYDSWEGYFKFTIVGSFIWIFARWANSRKQQQELRIVEDRKAELEALVKDRTAELTQQKVALQKTVEELKVTQTQLIQQEKLASLGELTAGIAHEIQNPLNFVNNFSELSVELVDELNSGPLQMLPDAEKGHFRAILQDLTQNLQKIHHHGKRADSIVKGMLQHTRASTGQKELTDINALAEEYIRLSYHGLRAKDKSFCAKMETHFDNNIPKLEVVPQDLGRVLLNLFNNAFYAVQQKMISGALENYQPLVQVSTIWKSKALELRIRDNGCGIPENIRHKILQPFFTTKPTGQGTGLGLSLSYDIITKGHNGEIRINSKEGEYTEFIIRLPMLNLK